MSAFGEVQESVFHDFRTLPNIRFRSLETLRAGRGNDAMGQKQPSGVKANPCTPSS